MSLPENLKELSELFDEWSIDDLARRAEKLASATRAELQGATRRVLPKVDAIDEHLAAFGNAPLDESARRLVLLAECALEAQHELEIRDAPDAFPE
jgi:hypothetical protein